MVDSHFPMLDRLFRRQPPLRQPPRHYAGWLRRQLLLRLTPHYVRQNSCHISHAAATARYFRQPPRRDNEFQPQRHDFTYQPEAISSFHESHWYQSRGITATPSGGWARPGVWHAIDAGLRWHYATLADEAPLQPLHWCWHYYAALLQYWHRNWAGCRATRAARMLSGWYAAIYYIIFTAVFHISAMINITDIEACWHYFHFDSWYYYAITAIDIESFFITPLLFAIAITSHAIIAAFHYFHIASHAAVSPATTPPFSILLSLPCHISINIFDATPFHFIDIIDSFISRHYCYQPPIHWYATLSCRHQLMPAFIFSHFCHLRDTDISLITLNRCFYWYVIASQLRHFHI